MNVQRLPLTRSMMDENELGSVYSMGVYPCLCFGRGSCITGNAIDPLGVG